MKNELLILITFFIVCIGYSQSNDSIVIERNIIHHKAKGLSIKNYLTSIKANKKVLRRLQITRSDNSDSAKNIIVIPKKNAVATEKIIFKKKANKKIIQKKPLPHEISEKRIVLLPKIKALTLREYFLAQKTKKQIIRRQ